MQIQNQSIIIMASIIIVEHHLEMMNPRSGVLHGLASMTRDDQKLYMHHKFIERVPASHVNERNGASGASERETAPEHSLLLLQHACMLHAAQGGS